MSDLSIYATPEVVVSPPRKAAVEVKSSDVSANASSHRASVDVSNYVTSPKGVVDPQSGVYVLQYRDGATGEVLNQYPSEKVVDAYKRGASNGEAKSAPVETVASGVSTPSGSSGVSGTAGVSTSAEGSMPTTPVSSVGSSGTTSSIGQSSTPSARTSVEA